MNKLASLVENFRNKRTVVVGDIMLDKYIFGKVNRISPEAPVQIVNVTKESFVPGGAANVANNIASLNGAVYIVGVAGDDDAKNILINELEKRRIGAEGVITDIKRPTTQKIRVIGHSQQLLRVDYEEKEYLNRDDESKAIAYIKNIIKNTDVVVVSDYAKGVITKELMNSIISFAKEKNKIVIIDPKPKHSSYYAGAALITPNIKEAFEMAGCAEETDIEEVGKRLVKKFNSAVLITRGEHGMSLFEKNNEVTHIQTRAKEVYDVTGAGDTVVAVLALSLGAGANLKEAAEIANQAAGIVVGKIGTSTVTADELKKALEEG